MFVIAIIMRCLGHFSWVVFFRCVHWSSHLCMPPPSRTLGKSWSVWPRKIHSWKFQGQITSCFYSILSWSQVWHGHWPISFHCHYAISHPKKFPDVCCFCRNCIGQHFAMHEMRSVLALLLKNFKFQVDEDRIPELSPDLVLRAKGGLWLKVLPIEEWRVLRDLFSWHEIHLFQDSEILIRRLWLLDLRLYTTCSTVRPVTFTCIWIIHYWLNYVLVLPYLLSWFRHTCSYLAP